MNFDEEIDAPDSVGTQNCLQYSFGYDEISETHISIAACPDEGNAVQRFSVAVALSVSRG